MELDGLKPGMRFTYATKVEENHTAASMASGALPVFATPYMIAHMEWAALKAVSEALPPGMSTVGTKVDVVHLAATPVGMEVKITAELMEIDRRKLTFQVEAWVGEEMIGQGTHERFVIDVEKFMAKTNGKL